MPWQHYVAHVATEVDPATGWYAYDHVVLTVPRRAGKSALTTVVKVHRLATVPRARLWMSAQNRDKALERWNDVKESLEGSPLDAFNRAYTSIGHERIVWNGKGPDGKPTRGKLVPFKPDGDLLHGEAIDLLDLDEIWSYDAVMRLKMQQGYRPTFLTTNAQAWLYSTAGTVESVWLNDLRTAGRLSVERGETHGTAYFEWSMPEMIDGVPWRDVGDLEILIKHALAAHPAVGFHPRVPEQRMRLMIAQDIRDLAKEHGAGAAIRPYGNLTGEPDVDRLIPASVVAASTTLDRIPTAVTPGLGFDVDPDRRAATICSAWRDSTGRGLLEVIEHGLGTRWVAGAVIGILERQGIRQVTCNNAGPARDIADEIERAANDNLAPGEEPRWAVQRISAPDWAAACVRVNDELKVTPRPTVMHNGSAELVEAFKQTGKRTLGQSWAFASTGEPITPVTGCTAALWGADHPPPAPIDYGEFRVR